MEGDVGSVLRTDGRDVGGTFKHLNVSLAHKFGSQEPTGKDALPKKTKPGSPFTTADPLEDPLDGVSKLLDRTVAVLDVEEREKLDAEIVRIPVDEKTEYLNALRLASSFVIEKEANPVMFVLIENHEYDRAARRMIDYWKNRKNVFGDRAYRSVFDLSGNGALSLEELEPFRRSLEHVILPFDSMGRSVIYFDDEFLESGYYRDVYADTRQRILFLLLNFVALTNMPISQREGILTVRVIRRENYDLTKAVKHGSLLSFMPLISHAIHFCGIPPKGARRYFKDYLVPLLVGSSENRSDQPKEKMTNSLAPFQILSKFHMSSRRQSIASKLEECGFRRTGIPISLGGEWSSLSIHSNATNFDPLPDREQSNMLSIWSLIIRNVSSGSFEKVNRLDCAKSEDTKDRDHRRKVDAEKRHVSLKDAINAASVTVPPDDSAMLTSSATGVAQARICVMSPFDKRHMEQGCKPPPVPCSGFKLLSKEANEAIVQQRKCRKRQMDVIYARHRRSRDRCEVMILQERVAFISQSNQDLSKENFTLTKILTDARAMVARFELESNIVNSRILMNSNAPENSLLLTSEQSFLTNACIGPNARDVTVHVPNLSMSSFPMRDFQGSLPVMAPLQSLLRNPLGQTVLDRSLDACLVQHLLELTSNYETAQLLRQGLVLVPSSNTSTSRLDRLCDSHAMLPALLQCQNHDLLLSQVLGRQPFPPDVNFRRPGLILEGSNVLSARSHAELLEQLRFLEMHRRI
jgi:hypothetical protein